MDYRYRYIMFIKPDGNKISGKLFLPAAGKNMDGSSPLVIFSHGFGTNYRELEHYGPDFAERGIVMLLFDYCGGSPDSESDGSTTQMSVLTEADDLLFVLRQVREQTADGRIPADPKRIFLMGESQGGYESALVAARYPAETAGVILWYPAFCLQDMGNDWKRKCYRGYTHEMWGIPLGKKYTEDAANVDIYSEIAAYGGKGLIIHGDADPTVSIDYSYRAIKVVPGYRLVTIPGAVHGFEGEECRQAAEASIDFILTAT